MEGLHCLWKKIPFVWRLAGPGLLLVLAVIALLQGRSDGRLHLYFLDVGQGNAVLVLTPSGRCLLVDGGSDPTALLTALGRPLPFWQRHLDMVLLTETLPERMTGPVAVPGRYRVRAAGRPVRPWPGPGWQRWLALLAAQGVEPLSLQRGAVVDLGDGVILEVLHPSAVPLAETVPGGRDDALVLRLRYGDFSALLPTAAGPAVQQALLDDGAAIGSTLLLIPRQAEHEAVLETFLAAVGPRVAVVSAGTGYHQGPDARTLRLVRDAGAVLYRTDLQGTIQVRTDGERVEVRVQR